MKRILVIHTGGTFGMVPVPPHRTLVPDELAEHLLTHVPELKRIAHIDVECIFHLDSADIQIPHWVQLGQRIADNASRYDGFVIIHGTDSMVYTAAALSFMLRHFPKPVILTGSQRPLAEIRSDARLNLINSVELATYPIPEVCICFGAYLFRGNRTIKYSTINYDAFISPNYPPLAEMGIDIRIFQRHRQPKEPFQFLPHFSSDVVCWRYIPGLQPRFVEALEALPVKAIVFEALGLGNMAIKPHSMVEAVYQLCQQGKLVVITSQCPHGQVDLQRYENGVQLLKAGAIGAGDMTTETTVVKLMHLLALEGDNVAQLRRLLLQDIAGEITIKH